MFASYIKSTLRDAAAHRAYSAINILGLAVGLAACLLIIIFVRGEFGYDSFVPAAGGLALAIAWATVAGHAARAARANPIHA